MPYHTVPYHTILYHTIPCHSILQQQTLNTPLYIPLPPLLIMIYYNIPRCIFYLLRSDGEQSTVIIKPFDWTFTTDYKGSLISGKENIKFKVVNLTVSCDICLIKPAKQLIILYTFMLLLFYQTSIYILLKGC